MSITSLRVRGPFRGASGYDSHVRSFVRELHRQGVRIQLEQLDEWKSRPLPPDQRDPLFDSLDEPVDAPIVLQFCMPHQMKWNPGLIDVNFTMYESPRIPGDWVDVGRKAALTILPTESSQAAWVASGVPARRLDICPLGIDPNRFYAGQTPLPIELPGGIPYGSYRFRFLNVVDLTTRKNPSGLLRTWLRATSADDDAVLLIKLNGSRETADEAEALFSLIQGAQKRSRSEAAPVHFIYDQFTDEEMGRLYCSATHYFSMSHGEGWDLPMTEALASGLVPIAPNHSAYQSYLDSTTAYLIPSTVGPTRAPKGRLGGIPYGFETWWHPDERHATEIIRGVIDQTIHPVMPTADLIRTEYSWEASTTRLLAVLDELAQRGTPRRFQFPVLPKFWRRDS